MTTTPRIDKTARDYASIKNALIQFIQARFPDDITDFTEATLGMSLLEMYAWIGDMLSFTLDRVANEVYLSTATERPNVLALAKMLGYKVRPASAASGVLSIVLGAVYGQPVLIVAGTQLKVGDVTYEVLEAYSLPANTLEAGPGTSNPGLPGVKIGEGASFTERFIATGSPFQTYTTIINKVIRDSIHVFVDGILWQVVDSLVFASDTTQYALTFTADGRAVIRFGDNLTGLSPQAGQEINIVFRSGGGTIGNAAANFIATTLQGTLPDSSVVKLPVRNTSPIAGGAEAETIESIKFNAPRHLKTHGNAITQEDWNTLASNFSDPSVGTVANAVVVPRLNRTNSGANEVDIYFWTRGVNNILLAAPQTLQDAAKAFLLQRAIWNIDIFTHGGSVKPINITATVRVDTRFSDTTDMQGKIDQKIKTFFNRTSIRPGSIFHVSELFQEIQSIGGVLFCNLQATPDIPEDPLTPLQDVVTDPTEIYVLGTLDLTVTVQGQTEREEIILEET